MMLRPVWHDQRGGISLLLAGALFMLVGAATVGVDLGSIYLAKRQLQGIADAAAMAAVNGGQSAVEQLVKESKVEGVSLARFETGRYTADPAIAVPNRFLPGDAAGGAARVEVQRDTPLFFGRLLVGKSGVALRARAVAARRDLAAFSLGTGLAALSGGLPNMLLSSLAGTELNLSVMDTQGLASLNVDVLGMADALRVRTGRNDDAYGALFDRDIPLSDILSAMADSAGGNAGAGTLLGLAGRIAGRSARLSDIIDLGPARGAGSATGQPNLTIDALTMLRMLVSPPAGTSVPVDLRINVTGLASTRLMIVVGEGQARSPLMTVTDSRDIVVRTGQMRLYLEANILSLLPGIATVRAPIYVELAAAEARLSDINCAQYPDAGGVTLSVKPSIGSAMLAEVDTHALTNFTAPPNARPATLAQVLTTKISGHAQVALGGTQAQTVHFSPGDISAQRVKRVSTNDLSQGIAGSLAKDVKLTVTALGIQIPLSPLASAVGGVLGTAAPLLDEILNSVTATLGVRLGNADVRVHDLRCGLPAIVA